MSQIWKKPASSSTGNRWSSPATDYNDQLSKMMRMPSILPNVPHYPNVHNAFNKKETSSEDEEDEEEEEEVLNKTLKQRKNKPSARFQDQVQVIEFEKEQTTDSTNVDAKADGFIRQKRKGFELCKWTTFK